MASRFNDAAWRVERALVRIYGSAPEVQSDDKAIAE